MTKNKAVKRNADGRLVKAGTSWSASKFHLPLLDFACAEMDKGRVEVLERCVYRMVLRLCKEHFAQADLANREKIHKLIEGINQIPEGPVPSCVPVQLKIRPAMLNLMREIPAHATATQTDLLNAAIEEELPMVVLEYLTQEFLAQYEPAIRKIAKQVAVKSSRSKRIADADAVIKRKIALDSRRRKILENL